MFFKDLIDTGVKQWEIFKLVKSLGVSKIEIRREWIVDFQKEIEIMALEVERQGIELLYSVPIPLFSRSSDYTSITTKAKQFIEAIQLAKA